MVCKRNVSSIIYNKLSIQLFLGYMLSYINQLYFDEKSLGLCMGRDTLSRWCTSSCTIGSCFYLYTLFISQTVFCTPGPSQLPEWTSQFETVDIRLRYQTREFTFICKLARTCTMNTFFSFLGTTWGWVCNIFVARYCDCYIYHW